MTDVPNQAAEPLTVVMLQALEKTRGWVRFLAILGYLAVALMVVAGVLTAGAGFQTLGPNPAEGVLLFFLAAGLVLMALLYLVPARHLHRYAGAIDEAVRSTAKAEAVERALGHQRAFWKFAGILTIVSLFVVVPAVLAAILFPNYSSAQGRSRQKRSMADLRSIGTAVEAYAVDNDSYPQASSVQELSRVLEPSYIKKLPLTDGWGAPFAYEAVDCENGVCKSYFIASGGKDKVIARSPLRLYKSDKFEPATDPADDIVFHDGNFIRAPEGSGNSSVW